MQVCHSLIWPFSGRHLKMAGFWLFVNITGQSDVRIQNGKIMTTAISFLKKMYSHKWSCSISVCLALSVSIITRVVPAGQVCVSCSEQSNKVIVHVNAATVAHNIGYSLPHRAALILSYYVQHATILSIMQGQYCRLGRLFLVISM